VSFGETGFVFRSSANCLSVSVREVLGFRREYPLTWPRLNELAVSAKLNMWFRRNWM
ncbi:hypothetical protein LINPERHAP1_LOCUS8328, partial [Linum perenne]